MTVNISDVDSSRVDVKNPERLADTKVVYITGPLYFGTSSKLGEKLHLLEKEHGDKIIFSMRGVPVADISGVQTLMEICENLTEEKVEIYFSCVQPQVEEMLIRCGLTEKYAKERFFWSTDKALIKLADEKA